MGWWRGDESTKYIYIILKVEFASLQVVPVKVHLFFNFPHAQKRGFHPDVNTSPFVEKKCKKKKQQKSKHKNALLGFFLAANRSSRPGPSTGRHADEKLLESEKVFFTKATR